MPVASAPKWRHNDGHRTKQDRRGRSILMTEATTGNSLTTARIGRRSLLLGGAGLAASRLAAPFIGSAAAAEPIKIGMIWAKTGQIVDQAEYLAQGGMLALEQRNNMLLDRPCEIVWLDEPNPQGAQQSAERLIG